MQEVKTDDEAPQSEKVSPQEALWAACKRGDEDGARAALDAG
jgi:hypothetical protein